ncbi:MAG: SAM-dependent chlorinase/fluorinase [Bacteroidetes bacterium]|nr:SAM-dependent chlorinase/fluorinase [Bacteroidota bacterium]
MPVITLTTDWGTKDYFTGAIKGDILSNCSNATIVDITHQLNVFDLVSGAFIFRNSWHRFPEGTVHIIGVSSIQSGALEMIAFKHLNHFFWVLMMDFSPWCSPKHPKIFIMCLMLRVIE